MEYLKLPKDAAICGICLEFPHDPVECVQCSQLFCHNCIQVWFEKSSKFSCPIRCEFGSLKKVRGTLKSIMDKLEMLNFEKQENCMDIEREKNIDWRHVLLKRDKAAIETIKQFLANIYNVSI